MMNINWTNGPALETSTTLVVQVSELRLRLYRDVPGFLRHSLAIRKTVLAHDGAIGMALRAAPLRRTFWTLSAWDSRRSLGSFMSSDSHKDVMVRYRERMAGSHFHTWFDGEVDELPPTWDHYLPLFEADKAQQ